MSRVFIGLVDELFLLGVVLCVRDHFQGVGHEIMGSRYPTRRLRRTKDTEVVIQWTYPCPHDKTLPHTVSGEVLP